MSATSSRLARASAQSGSVASNRALDGNKAEAAATAALLLLIVALWLATRPYYGIVQDARFYVIQAIRELHPTRFADDLYFRFGATDQFTVFPKLYAPVVAIFGVATAGLLCTIAGQLLWVGGLAHLARALIADRRLALLSVAAVIALPGGYGHYGYGEPFATPRLFAEALTMAALGFLLQRRAGWALALLVLSAVLHPLMTLPGMAVALGYLAMGRPVWWLAIGAAAAAAAGMVLSGVPPFANFRAAFDPVWFEIARTRDSQWLISAWSLADYFRVLGTIALAGLALAASSAAARRLVATALAVALAGVLCTLIGADVAHDVLIAQILPWRSLWPLTLLAQLYAASVCIWVDRLGDAAGVTKAAFLSALGCLLASRLIPPLVFAAAPMMVIAAVLAIWQYRTGRPLPAIARAGCRLAIAASGATTIVFACEFVSVMRPLPEELGHRVFAFVVVLAALMALILQTSPTGAPRSWPAARLPLLSAVLVVAALFAWDMRTPWTKMIEASGGAPPALAALLPAKSSVYWEGGVEMLWLRLQRPSYFSCAQGTGAVFFRPAAIEFQRRAAGLQPLHTLDFADPECQGFAGSGKPMRTRRGLERACRDDPGLDYLVLRRPLEGVDATIWTSPVPFRTVTTVGGTVTPEETNRFYIYSCAVAGRA